MATRAGAVRSLSPVSPRERIATARLYLVCDARPRAFLEAALRGGADIVQLRDKTLGDDELVAAAREFRAAADAHGALFILNDRPDLVAACRADGVHVGQDDGSPAAARAIAGPDAIVGRSTHAPDAGRGGRRRPGRRLPRRRPRARDADEARPPRRGPGLRALGRRARRHTPWFAIGGLDAATTPAVVALGARRIVVVRAITDAADPEAAARALRAALEEAPVGAAQP